MGHRLRIGLTGGIASGKTTVAVRFGELGVPVIDADEVAREEVAPGSVGLRQVVERFGPQVLNPEGHLDRRALRGLIFSNASLRKDLEAILHPLIRATMDSRTSMVEGPYVVLAIPLLLEGGTSAGRVDRILVLDIEPEVQLIRVMARDGCSAAQARAIIAVQASRATRLEAADDVLANHGSLEELRSGVDALHGRYLGLARAIKSR